MASDRIEFIRNGKVEILEGVKPTDTLLDYLRLKEANYGTKEGCNEGDCGACSVVLGREVDGEMHYRAVNSCIYFVGMLDGQELISVEDLSAKGEALHPVQAAMVKHHASQCGFCTPGFVMALFALYHGEDKPSRDGVAEQLAGNLCRCTGYRPIVDAAVEVCDDRMVDKFDERMQETAKLIANMPKQDLFIGNGKRFFAAPKSIISLAKLYQRHPEATIVAGGTDVGLWVTKRLMDLPKVIYIGNVSGLDHILEDDLCLNLGAAVTYSDAEIQIGNIDSDIADTLRRIGSKQVRASGTVGGNIANGSPIGDMPPILLALGASIILQKGNEERMLALGSFFIDYGKQNIEQGEFLKEIQIPKLKQNEYFRCYKISKRFDQDISAVMAAFQFTIIDGVIKSCRLAFGGMAATPKRAFATEHALKDMTLDEFAEGQVEEMLDQDFSPLSDMRASAEYRMLVSKNLLTKALTEISDEIDNIGVTSTRVVGNRAANWTGSSRL